MQPVPNIDHLLSNIGRTRMPTEGLGKYIQIAMCIVFYMSRSFNTKEKIECSPSKFMFHFIHQLKIK